MRHILRWLAFVMVIVTLMVPTSAYADVAPPGHPPGSNPEPGAEGTQVRMMAETVLIDILPNNDTESLEQAKVTANFTMRNLGSEAESMAVRFPIGADDGWVGIQEIEDVRVFVNDRVVSTRRIMDIDPQWHSYLVPWVEFDVTFLPGVDVKIRVTYLLNGTGEYPNVSFSYIFHTGAGWKDTIGSADLTVHLPYDVNSFNILFEDTTWASTTPGGVVDGNQIHWRFENFEPGQSDDFDILLVNPSVWQKVLNERANVTNNPSDGEAWGRLGKLYKEMFFFRHGFRHDAGGQELYRLSVEAYENAVTLLPGDALWHAGFADLLAIHAYYASREGEDATVEVLRSMQEIDTALELSPNDAKVNEIAEKIYWLFPGAVELLESGYDFLWLTATPVVESPTVVPASSTPTLEAPPTSVFTATTAPTEEGVPVPETPAPTAGNSLCGSVVLIPLLLIWLAGRKLYS